MQRVGADAKVSLRLQVKIDVLQFGTVFHVNYKINSRISIFQFFSYRNIDDSDLFSVSNDTGEFMY